MDFSIECAVNNSAKKNVNTEGSKFPRLKAV
jgi:hypothetical protein